MGAPAGSGVAGASGRGDARPAERLPSALRPAGAAGAAGGSASDSRLSFSSPDSRKRRMISAGSSVSENRFSNVADMANSL